MKLVCALLVIAPLAACHTSPVDETAAYTPRATAATGLVLPAGSLNLASFLSACAEPAGINFTYTKATADALAATEVRFDGAKHVPPAEVEGFVASTLDAHGFALKPIGPPHLHVLLVEAKRG
jgi:hypothetical protein